MGNLINVAKPLRGPGSDARMLNRTVAAVIEALNDIKVKIITSDGAAEATISEGEILIDLTNVMCFSDGYELIPNFGGEGSSPTSGGTDLKTTAQSGGEGN